VVISSAGGLGVGGNIYAGGNIRFTSTTDSTDTITGALTVTGGVGVTGNIYAGGLIRFTNTTGSTNSISGALTVGGGLGVNGNIHIPSGYGVYVNGVALSTGGGSSGGSSSSTYDSYAIPTTVDAIGLGFSGLSSSSWSSSFSNSYPSTNFYFTNISMSGNGQVILVNNSSGGHIYSSNGMNGTWTDNPFSSQSPNGQRFPTLVHLCTCCLVTHYITL
jgi:hypothetical protein